MTLHINEPAENLKTDMTERKCARTRPHAVKVKTAVV